MTNMVNMEVNPMSALDKISTMIGRELWFKCTTHDDGIDATGGELVMITGATGSGKSTLDIQFAALSRHIDYKTDNPRSKEDIWKHHLEVPAVNETIVWRGRKYDHWNIFMEENWKRSYPKAHYKPLTVFLPEPEKDTDNITFITEHRGQVVTPRLSEGDDLVYYRTVNDIYHHIKKGGINVIFEPIRYCLPRETVQYLTKQQLKIEVPADMCGEIPAPSPVWWFEFSAEILKLKRREEFYTIIMDEAHQVFPTNPQGKHWFLIAGFANLVIDFRKKNISFIPSTQDSNLLDYRIVDRMTHFIWLRGSKPNQRRSRVSPKLVGCLRTGKGLIERSNERFGQMDFNRIPAQPPVITAEGLPSMV